MSLLALQVSKQALFNSTIHVFCLVPFDEDDKDVSVWFLDHNYLENMSAMYKKVNGQYKDIITHGNDLKSFSSRTSSWLVPHGAQATPE